MDIEKGMGSSSKQSKAQDAPMKNNADEVTAPYQSMEPAAAGEANEGLDVAVTTSGEEEQERRGGVLSESLSLYRWAEILVFLIVLIISFHGTGRHTMNKMYMPQVTTIQGGIVTVIANSTAHSYPLLFKGGVVCPPSTLQQCFNSIVLDPACCNALAKMDKPYETVPNEYLIVICTLIPAVFMLLRWLLFRFLHVQIGEGEDKPNLRDMLVGYLFGVALTEAFTNSIKNLVGCARPNYYALTLYSNALSSSKLANRYVHKSYQSFPSGHSSLSMNCGLYISLLLLSDIRRRTRMCSVVQRFRAILIVLALAPVYLSIYVGCTRMIDFYHNPVDVTCGWMIGVFCALLSYWHAIPSNVVKTNTNPHLKYC